MGLKFNPLLLNGFDFTGSSGGGGGVSSVNALTGAVVLAAGSGITLTPSGNTITIASTGGSGANTTLSNLTSPTSINQDLLPGTNDTLNLGNASFPWSNVETHSIGFPSGMSINMANGRLIDNSGNISILVSQRQLIWTNGTTPMLDWTTAGILNASTNRITNVADPTGPQDVATRAYVLANAGGANTALSNLASTAVNVAITPISDSNIDLGTSLLRWGTLFVRSVNSGSAVLSLTGSGITANGLRIQNVGTPTTSTDAATKAYVDAAGSGANTALSNLTTTSINQDLLPSADVTHNLGSNILRWNQGFIAALLDGSNVNSINVNARRLQNSSGSIVLTYSGSNLDFNNLTLTNIANPVNPQDAATKNYVDNKILVFTSTATVGGAAAEAVTVTGLLATDTVLSVSPKTNGGANVPFVGWDTQINNGITVHYTADMGPGAVVLVAVKR